MSNSANRFITALSAVMSLPELRFNEDLVCCVSSPGELNIQMEWVPQLGRLMVLAPVGHIGDDPKLARTLLAANFLFAGTRGESLSLEDGTDRVFLCAGIDLDEVSTEHAIDVVTRFVDTARQWIGYLSGSAPAPTPSGNVSFIRV
jgi:hypothetical protein